MAAQPRAPPRERGNLLILRKQDRRIHSAAQQQKRPLY
jgi:hypothetical protein